MLSDASHEGLKNHTLHLPWETGVSRKVRRAAEFANPSSYSPASSP